LPSPKAFISYSWSSDHHQQWVINLATQLRENSVDVILDKWDLKEGHDAIAFMEQMVSDVSVKKVIVILDRVYAEKADGRQGGVGTETQIITPQIYKSVDQNKFVGVISEVDADGKPFLPTFYQSRIYIDLSDEEIFSQNFDQLLRWIFDKPAFPKPALGSVPGFLNEENVLLPTRSRASRALGLLRAGSPLASGALQDYLEGLSESMEVLRISPETGVEFDDQVIKSIASFLPYRDELLSVITVVVRLATSDQNNAIIKRFFENLIPYMFRPSTMNQWSEHWFDNYKFIVHEMFLYVVAIMIRHERFDVVDEFLAGDFFAGDTSDFANTPLQSFSVFRHHLQSLDIRKNRLKLNRTSLQADLIKDRIPAVGISLRDLMQADLVLLLRDGIESLEAGRENSWWPVTLIWAERYSAPFEIFARAESTKYFHRINAMFAGYSRDALIGVLEKFGVFGQGKPLNLPQWNYHSVSFHNLMRPEKMATRP
jgi:hypothetical protein